MYSNDEPKIHEERYFIMVEQSRGPTLAKVVVENRWEDKDAGGMVNKIKIIQKHFSPWSVNAVIHIDYDWQLPKTLEDAKRIMMLGIFSRGGDAHEAWYYRKPPWE